ncbi:MAG: DoxX family protein [Pseudomonadota bacterium]
MKTLISLQRALFGPLERADWLLSTLARFLFAAILLMYFWVSGLTKLGDGLFGFLNPSLGAYAQIWPRAMEAAGYDVTQMTGFQTLVVMAGTWAEFILPVLIIIGLLTRFAALGMIVFVIVQSLTDLIGHNKLSDPIVFGAWFDKAPDGIIMDQRMLWIFLLLVLVMKGAGPLSVDRMIMTRAHERQEAYS